MKPLFWMAFGRKGADVFLSFRESVEVMNDEDFSRIYTKTASCDLKKEADISPRLLARAIEECEGVESIADVGCGRGRLAQVLQEKKFSVFGIDLGRSCPSGLEGGYAVARTERIPFKDKAVDVAICAHVLEHIPDIFSALDELRRISALKIVVILPVERPYRFGFNLHVWFFPYRLNVMQIMRPKADVFWSLERIGNEWLYIEERS
ncbi:class I SAM-dependent methyltransferase [uncultured Alcanivorax sp.]|jgi:ubiquinone/menaquinone biosynthesis C-methylase UbiE|uniref:class I SAM-dependent methyltransferase n=1 Tax=uncultured Alcanivorax sp. TaxID=191215 RepID=UPI0030DDBD38